MAGPGDSRKAAPVMSLSRQVLSALVFVWLALFAANVRAQAAAAPNADLAEAIAKALRLDEMYRGLGEQMTQGFAQAPDWERMKPDRKATLERLARQTFDGARFTRNVTRGLARHPDRATMTAWLDLLRTPEAERIQAIEVAQTARLAGPTGEAALRESASRTMSDARRRLLEQLDDASLATETIAQVMAASMMAAGAALGQRIANPRAAFDQLRDRLRPVARAQSAQLYTFMYESLDDAAIARYIALYRTEASAKMTPVLMRIMTGELSTMMGEFFRAMQTLDKAPSGA